MGDERSSQIAAEAPGPTSRGRGSPEVAPQATEDAKPAATAPRDPGATIAPGSTDDFVLNHSAVVADGGEIAARGAGSPALRELGPGETRSLRDSEVLNPASVSYVLRSPSEGSSTQLATFGFGQGNPSDHQATVGDPALLDGQVTIISTRGPMDESGSARGLPPLEVGRRLEGERLGQFVLQKYVGGGGMGAVFRALDTTLNREVAVKVLSRFQSDEEETLRRFRNEAQSAARLDHINIARVYYVGCDRGLHYIVFEFIEGENVRDLVDRKGPLPIVEAVSYTLQIAEALTHASQRDVIHRDIKPSNVLVTPEGKAKLVDMGLARLHVDQPDQDITASGVTLGTFDYISPEQARDPRSADVRSDLYSLGCSLFFMLSGRPPFPHGTVLQKLLQHQGDEPPDAKSLRPDLPADVHRILNKLLAKNPDDRFQTPAELIMELVAAGRTLGLQPPSSVNVDWTLPVERPAPWWEKHLPWFVPLAALVVIVVTLDYVSSAPDAEAQSGNRAAEDSLAALGVSNPTADRPGATSPDRVATVAKSAARADRPLDPGEGASAGKVPGERSATAASRGSNASSPRAAKPDRGVPAGEAGRSDPRATASPIPDRKSIAADPDGAGKSDQTAGKSGAAPANSVVAPAGPTAAAPDQASPAAGEAAGEPPMPMPGDGGGNAEGAEPAAAAARQGLLVVGEPDERLPSFPTLAAATNAAKSGDVIELRYSGVRDERPIWLSNLKLTIRAGERHAPVVRFRPAANDMALSTRNMISIVGGQLSVINVRFEFDLPRPAVADDWALCSAQRADLLRFERCVLSVRNAGFGQAAFSPGVAFFRIQAPAGAASLVHESVPEGRAVELQLQNCVARGEATFLDVVDGEGVRLGWHNGFLATSERLLALHAPPNPRQAAAVEVDLQHLTAVTRGGLVLLDATERAGEPGPAAHVALADSIVALPAMAAAPLIEQRIVDRTSDFRSRLQWSGDRNFYQGFDVFWKVTPSGTDDALELSHSDWEAAWGESHEYLCRSGGVRWQALSAPSAAFDSLSPLDYSLLADGRMNPAVGAASDGRDVGYLADSLPAVSQTPNRDSAAKEAPVKASPPDPAASPSGP